MDHLTNLSMGVEFRPQYYRDDRIAFNPADDNFHAFPEKACYVFDDRQELVPGLPRKGGDLTGINCFLQSWLFFGLIATMVQLPRHEPFFAGDFLSEDGSQIDTSNLVKGKKYLEKWIEYEIQNKEDRTFRMIRAQRALDQAREVVQNHCSIDGKCFREGRINEELSLSLMVLGETLSSAKSKIVHEISFNIRGWHGDAAEGWGHPRCLISKMELAGWCPRTLHVLEDQLNSSATSILSVYKAYADSEFLKPGSHPDCKADRPCLVVSADTNRGVYKTQHHVSCQGKDCRMIGPPMAAVLKEIEHNNFPLLCYQQGEGGGSIRVHSYRPHDKYATISHVWADGYGNPKNNELWECQLKFIQSLFHKLPERPHDQQFILFWIDTLAIPVGQTDRHKQARQRAIKKIQEIYTKARYTIVIDNGLTQVAPSMNYEDKAMKILASGWMRRLWTLQEAYLSRRIYFAFKHEQLKNLDDLEDMYPKASDILTSSIPTAARNYFHNMLGPDRSAKINELSSRSGYGLIASVWRAAQWRTTAHKEHETLALATLLNVEYQDSISKVCLMPDKALQDQGPQLLVNPKKEKTQEDLDEMMKDLWKIIDETCPGSIPAGIIFLSGKRNSIKGYRWAPRSWMSGEKIEYPDPLSIMTSPATLTDKGLAVTYPGFLLHTRLGQSIIDTANEGQTEPEFHFAIDSSLLEWYVVDWHIEPLSNPPKGLQRWEKSFAIILCRARPRELPEIALLVEIEKIIKQRNLIDQRQSNTYSVSIICRVKIRREMKETLLSQWKQKITQSINQSETNEDALIFGEVLDDQQQWYVDGRPSSASMLQDAESYEISGTTKSIKSGSKRSGAQNKPVTLTARWENGGPDSSSLNRLARSSTSTFSGPTVNGRSSKNGRVAR